MKKIILMILLVLGSICYAQDNNIVINNHLVKQYLTEYSTMMDNLGVKNTDSLICSKIDFIIILSNNEEVESLGQTLIEKRAILLSNDVKLDRLILKGILYRELSHALGIPYNQYSVIMDRQREKGFSYGFFDNNFIVETEFKRILTQIPPETIK